MAYLIKNSFFYKKFDFVVAKIFKISNLIRYLQMMKMSLTLADIRYNRTAIWRLHSDCNNRMGRLPASLPLFHNILPLDTGHRSIHLAVPVIEVEVKELNSLKRIYLYNIAYRAAYFCSHLNYRQLSLIFLLCSRADFDGIQIKNKSTNQII